MNYELNFFFLSFIFLKKKLILTFYYMVNINFLYNYIYYYDIYNICFI